MPLYKKLERQTEKKMRKTVITALRVLNGVAVRQALARPILLDTFSLETLQVTNL